MVKPGETKGDQNFFPLKSGTITDKFEYFNGRQNRFVTVQFCRVSV